MPRTVSPLRYPGGKAKLYSAVKPIISRNIFGERRIYIEPFAGGAGLALQLLFNNDIDSLVLNDIDYNIFCFWDVCLHNADLLCELIQNCSVDMKTWETQREIYDHPNSHTRMEVAFSTFFLNRCNISGIIRGGPIGGHNQSGNYGLDARFNKQDLIQKIQKVHRERDNIIFYNYDVKQFFREVLPWYPMDNTILNIDPPYVKKGPMLYENSFTERDHAKLSEIIGSLPYRWIVTYDECDTIYTLYANYRKEIITLNYSAGRTKSGRELMIYSDNVDLNIPQVL